MSKADTHAIWTPERQKRYVPELDNLPTKTIVPEPAPIPVPRKGNPCTCEYCTATKLQHWYCDQCGNGPYRYAMNCAGTYQIARPLFARMKSWYSTTENRWIYEQRYACSKTCLDKEDGVITSELIELAGKRPDLREAIMSGVEEKRTNVASTTRDDLQPIRANEGGAYVPGVDDL